MTQQLKVGLIGAGWIAQHHIAGYLKSEKCDIVAVADPNEKAAQKLLAKYGIEAEVFHEYDKLLARKDISAVSICAPNKFHSEITVAAANAGKHILCEKPFVSSKEEAIQSVKAIRRSGVKCAVGFHRRFNPLYKIIKQYSTEGRLGEIFFAQCDYLHNQMQMPIIKWTLKKEFNPSLFHAGGSHCVDLLRNPSAIIFWPIPSECLKYKSTFFCMEFLYHITHLCNNSFISSRCQGFHHIDCHLDTTLSA